MCLHFQLRSGECFLWIIGQFDRHEKEPEPRTPLDFFGSGASRTMLCLPHLSSVCLERPRSVPIFRSTWTRERPHLSLAPGQVYTHEYERPAYELFDPEHLAKEDDA